MARPQFGYRNAAGKKIPGSTTVLKSVSLMDSDILCGWAAKLARMGKDWKSERSAAGAHGTMLHELCETRLPDALDAMEDKPAGATDVAWGKLQASYAAIREWYLKYGPKVIFAEQPLVSEAHQFGGTPDGVVEFPQDVPAYGVLAGDPWLFDYKSGSMVGAKEVAQMASYRQLLREAKGWSVRGAILLHAPTKEPGYMRPVILDGAALDLGWTVFTCG